MEFGGAWCPNQHAAGLPTRANARGRKTHDCNSETDRREEAESKRALSSKRRVVNKPFIVNTGVDYAGSATNATYSAELNRRLSEKSMPLRADWKKRWKVLALAQRA